MHIEHIMPLSHGDHADESNLCLACAWCHSYTWLQTQGVDPETHTAVPLLQPRTQPWHKPCRWSDNGV
jgi:hypothetical protein